MASKYFKAYKFLTGGKKRPGIVGVKPKSGGAVDEFKSRKLKQLGRTQRKLKSQFKEMGEAIKGAKKRGASRKDIVAGAKVQRDNRRRMREGDKLRKDVLRLGKAEGGLLGPLKRFRDKQMKPRDKRKPIEPRDIDKRPIPKGAPKDRPMRPGDKRKPIDPKTKKDSLREKIAPKKKMDRLKQLREELNMKKGGKVKKKFPDLTGDGKVTQADILKGRGVFKKGGGVKQMVKTVTSPITRLRNKMSKRKFGQGKK